MAFVSSISRRFPDADEETKGGPQHDPRPRLRAAGRLMAVLAVVFTVVVVVVSFHRLPPPLSPVLALARRGPVPKPSSCRVSPFPSSWRGPIADAPVPFLAKTRTLDPATGPYTANQPLETSMPIGGMKPGNRSIFRMMGFATPYEPSTGFGVEEYSLPPGADIVQVQMLSRHGARLPTLDTPPTLNRRIANASGSAKFKGSLAFLNSWTRQMSTEGLVALGREEMYRSGVLHRYMYGGLYNPRSKIIVRTLTQDRMYVSAETWLAGFFGLEWKKNATLIATRELRDVNNTLSGTMGCPKSGNLKSIQQTVGPWLGTFLRNAISRFQALTEGFTWTVADAYSAQMLCPYETVAYGSSPFCDLFTYQEWEHYDYATDIIFSSLYGFNSTTGRAIGIGYQQELVARLRNHTLGYPGCPTSAAPGPGSLVQRLYFDFSRDSNIVALLVAMGLRQFASTLPNRHYPGPHNFSVSRLTPTGARLNLELIRSPQPLSPARDGYLPGPQTYYVRLMLNQRTVPLGWSLAECDASRKDGWCELEAFLTAQERMPALAQYEYACFGNYSIPPYQQVTDGVPPSSPAT